MSTLTSSLVQVWFMRGYKERNRPLTCRGFFTSRCCSALRSVVCFFATLRRVIMIYSSRRVDSSIIQNTALGMSIENHQKTFVSIFRKASVNRRISRCLWIFQDNAGIVERFDNPGSKRIVYGDTDTLNTIGQHSHC